MPQVTVESMPHQLLTNDHSITNGPNAYFRVQASHPRTRSAAHRHLLGGKAQHRHPHQPPTPTGATSCKKTKQAQAQRHGHPDQYPRYFTMIEKACAKRACNIFSRLDRLQQHAHQFQQGCVPYMILQSFCVRNCASGAAVQPAEAYAS